MVTWNPIWVSEYLHGNWNTNNSFRDSLWFAYLLLYSCLYTYIRESWTYEDNFSRLSMSAFSIVFGVFIKVAVAYKILFQMFQIYVISSKANINFT